MSEIHIYTDGACSGNPGPGGWGVVIENGNKTQELFGGEDNTTNNRMEMMATIKGIKAVLNNSENVRLYTDSTYVKDGITLWVKNWQKNGWKTSNNKPVKNKDLWQVLLELSAKKNIDWNWVKGHSGHPQNERADILARNGVMKQMMKEAVQKIAQE